MVKSVFDEMSSSISDRERKDLLKKINRSMNLKTGTDESIYHVDVSKEEKDKSLRNEIASLGFFARLILKLKKIFSGRSEETIYNSMKFNQLKKAINKKAPGITFFETRTISKSFAEIVYKLYLTVLPLRELFEDFWAQGDTFNKVLTELINSRMTDSVKSVDDLLTDDEAEKVLFEKETKTAVKEEIIKKFNSHIKDIPDEIFFEMEDEILPLYYFRPVICFPYLQFLKSFGFNPYSENSSYNFKNASILACIDEMEKFYYAVYMVLKVIKPVKINSLIGKHFYKFTEDEDNFNEQVQAESIESDENDIVRELEDKLSAEESGENGENGETDGVPAAQGESGGNGDKSEEEKLKWFYLKMNEIHDECRRISKKIPLVELIKYYRNDYYYKLAFYIPKLRLKDFYFANLKIKMLEQVNSKYIKARNQLIEKNIDKFFKGRKMKKFMHFRIYTSFDYEKMGLSYFSHLKSMELLNNYLIHYYNPNLRQIIDLMTRTVLAQDKITANTIMMQISTIDDAFVKIQDFDNSLSPEMEDGKMFLRLRYGLGNDTAYLKMYKTFTLQKDKICQEITQKTLEAFDIIIKNFSELLNSSLYEVRNSLSAIYTINGKSKPYREYLSETVENIKYFKGLIVQLLKLEGGG
ncbi:MAG: hypothetical protein H7A26_07275 [Spirochaetales bacterium]|nr:hypothetical protein [Spirochaetales bacterium]